MKAAVDFSCEAEQKRAVEHTVVESDRGAKAAANLLLVPEGFTCVEIAQTIGGLTAATKQ
jgi:hypothetical protein